MATRESKLSKGTGRTFSSSPQPPSRLTRRSVSEARGGKIAPGDGERTETRAPIGPPPPPPHTSSTTATVLSEEVKQSQMFCFSRFINGRLGGGGNVKSLSFANDLADGVVFARLVSLTRDIGDLDPSSRNINALKSESTLSRRRDNLVRFMELLRNLNLLPPSCAKPSDASKIVADIVGSNIAATLDFTFQLLLKLQMARLKNVIQQAPNGDACFACLHSLIHGESGGRSSNSSVRFLNSLGDMQRLLLNWSSDLVKNRGLQVWNFNASIQDGKVLLAMIHALLPEVFPYDPVEKAGAGVKFSELKALNLATALGRLESPPLCVVNCVSFSREHGSESLEERSVVLLLSEFLIKACVVAARRSKASIKIQRVMRSYRQRNPFKPHKSRDKHRHHHHHHHRPHESKEKEPQHRRELISNSYKRGGENSFVRNRRVGSDTAGSDEAWLDAAEGDMTLANQSVDPKQPIKKQANHLPTDNLDTSQGSLEVERDEVDRDGVDGTLAAVTLQHEATLSSAPVAGPLHAAPSLNQKKALGSKWGEQEDATDESSKRFEAEKQQWLDSLEKAFLKSDKAKSGMLSSSIVYDGLRESTPGASKNDLMDLINDWKLPDGRVMYMNMITSLKSHTPSGDGRVPRNPDLSEHSLSDEFELGAGVSIGLSDDRKSEGDIMEEPSPGGVSDQIRRHRMKRGGVPVLSSPPSTPDRKKEKAIIDKTKEKETHRNEKESLNLKGMPPVPPRQNSGSNVNKNPSNKHDTQDKNDFKNEEERVSLKLGKRNGSASALSDSHQNTKVPIIAHIRPSSASNLQPSGSAGQNNKLENNDKLVREKEKHDTTKLVLELEALRSESLNYGLLQEAATSLQTAHEVLLEEHKAKIEELQIISSERDKLASKLQHQNQVINSQPAPSLSSKVSNDNTSGDRHSDPRHEGDRNPTPPSLSAGVERAKILKLEQELLEVKNREKKLAAELDLIKTTEKLNRHQHKPNSATATAQPTADVANPLDMSTSEVKTWLEKCVFGGTGRIPSVCLDLDGRSLYFLAISSVCLSQENSGGVMMQGTQSPWDFLRYVQESFSMSAPIALRFAYELKLLFPPSFQSRESRAVSSHVSVGINPESPLKRYGFPTSSRGRSRSKDKEERSNSMPRQPPPSAPPPASLLDRQTSGLSENEFLKKDLEFKKSEPIQVDAPPPSHVAQSNESSPVKNVLASPGRAKASSPSSASRMLFRYR